MAAERLPEDYYSPAAMALARFLWRPVLIGPYRYRADGIENVPAEGPAIIAPNHTTYLDPVFVTYPMRRPLHYLTWHKVVAVPFLGRALRALGAIPVDIDVKSDRAAYAAAKRVLDAGNLLCIFPEGLRGWDGKLTPLQAGAARLSVATGAPIVPVWIEGGLDAWPRWQKLPSARARVRVNILPPLRPEGFAGGKHERAAAMLAALERALVGAGGG